MTTGRDDDALTWDGDDDPTLDIGARGAEDAGPEADSSDPAPAHDVAAPVELPDGFTAVGKGSETVAAATTEDAASRTVDAADEPAPVASERTPMGNAELISLGALGGFSALFAVGWLIGGLRLRGTAEFLVVPLAYQVSLWLAVVAPLVWFATVLVLTRSRRLWVRLSWLVGGILLLVPWPFIMVGAIGR